MLNISHGVEIPQDTLLLGELGEKGYRFILERFTDVVEHGNLRALPKGVYIIPCFKDVDGSYEVIWVLLNVA